MALARARHLSLLVVLGLAAGCGDDDGDPPPPDGGMDTGPADGATDTFVPGDAGPTVDYTFEVRDLLSGSPVTVADLCVVDVPQIACVRVDETGTGVLAVPVNADIQVESRATRYLPWRVTLRTGDTPRNVDIDQAKTSNIDALVGVAGIDLDRTKGHFAFLVEDPDGTGTGGVSGAADPPSGDPAIYVGTDSLPDPTLSATVYEAGLGVIANLDPGRYDVVLTTMLGECEVADAWEGSGPGRIAGAVGEGTLTLLTARCPRFPPVEVDAGVPDAGMDAGVDAGAGDAGADGG